MSGNEYITRELTAEEAKNGAVYEIYVPKPDYYNGCVIVS